MVNVEETVLAGRYFKVGDADAENGAEIDAERLAGYGVDQHHLVDGPQPKRRQTNDCKCNFSSVSGVVGRCLN